MDAFSIISICLLVLLLLSSVALNSFCLNVIRKSEKLLKKSSMLLISNLLLLQLFQACVVLPFYIARQCDDGKSATWSRNVCNGFRFSYMVAFYGTCLGVFLTSIDRFFAVFWILKYKTHVTKQRVGRALIFLWFYLLIVSIVPFAYPPEVDHEFIPQCKAHMNHVKCNYNQPKYWLISMITMNTVVPYIAMVFMYVYIVKKVKYYERKAIARNSTCLHVTLPNQIVITIKKKDMTKHKKITKMAFMLCFVYAVLWTPSALFYTLKHICPTCFGQYYNNASCFVVYIEFSVNFVAFLNLLAVPIIYCFYQQDFRTSANLRKSFREDIEEKKLLPSDL